MMSEEEINALIERCQSPEVQRRKDAFFAELDRMDIIRNSDGSYDVFINGSKKRSISNDMP